LNVIKIAGTICNQRSKAALVNSIKTVLPQFMGFEEVGLVLRDVKTNQIFSINELQQEEKEEWYKEELKSRGLTKVLDKNTQKDIELAFDQFKETRTICYPHGQGITGIVLES